MNGNYIKPGIAAIALALLFPLYWSTVLVIGLDNPSFMESLRRDMLTVGWLDGLFLIIGILEVYIYLNLIRSFKERLNSSMARILLFTIVGTIVFFHSVVFVDLFLAVFKAGMSAQAIEGVINISAFISLAALVVYVIAGLVLSVLLLVNKDNSIKLLKYFAVLLLTVCLLQASVLLAIVNLVVFPIALITLAVYFFKDPESLEVI